jgi:hypothetical protein
MVFTGEAGGCKRVVCQQNGNLEHREQPRRFVRTCATKKVRTARLSGFISYNLNTNLMGMNHKRYISKGKEGRL